MKPTKRAEPTHNERVLAKAKSFDGVCQADFGQNVCDGLEPISRVGARLYELETLQGHVFERIGWRSKCKCFRWVEGPGVVRGATPEPSTPMDGPPVKDCSLAQSTGQDQLFTPEPEPHWRAA